MEYIYVYLIIFQVLNKDSILWRTRDEHSQLMIRQGPELLTTHAAVTTTLSGTQPLPLVH